MVLLILNPSFNSQTKGHCVIQILEEKKQSKVVFPCVQETHNVTD